MSTTVLLRSLRRSGASASTVGSRIHLNCSNSAWALHTKSSPDNAEQQVNSNADNTVAAKKDGGTDTISKAMSAYLQRAKEHQEFIGKQEKEFVFGRRHLANMMGKDPETFNQDDINEAIRYLFPSGLYEPRARPMMKPPREIYPKQKAAQFDMSGRPHHPFFYTAQPNFFFMMHEMVEKLTNLNALAPGATSWDESEVDVAFAGTKWLQKNDLESRLMEKITDRQYSEWLNCAERLACHPKRDKELEFIKSCRKAMEKEASKEKVYPVTLEPDGRKSCHVDVCMRKSARGEVKVTVPGTGKFNINGKGLDFFRYVQSREVVISPLQLVGWLGKADVDAYVTGGRELVEHQRMGGETARAGCLRWGIATALASLGADAEKLRISGLLTRDHRQHERTKCGITGPRATWTWKKR